MNQETEGADFEFSRSINQEPVNREIIDADNRLSNILRQNWDECLDSENYEESAQALGEVKALREWRNRSRTSDFSSFYRLFESAGAVDRSAVSPEESALLKQTLSDRLMPRAQGLTPRVADIYKAILSEMDGSGYSPQFKETQQKVAELREAGDLDLLLDGNVPFAVKANRIQTRLEGDLLGRRALDRRDRRSEEREPVDQPSTPPPTQDESKPGMDEMERSKEGETPPAIWTIATAYGGYFKQQSFDSWDHQTNVWRQSEYQYSPIRQIVPDIEELKTQKRISANLPAGQWTRLPLPYSYALSTENLSCEVKIDQNGDHIVFSQNGGPVSFEIFEGSFERPMPIPDQPPQFVSQFEEETLNRLREIAATKKGNLAKARAAAGWTMRRLNYSNDSSFNQIYDTHPAGYIAAIDEHRQADCDVANTYFAALCETLSVPVRHVVGHMVKGKDNEGNSRITSGTGHAWSEVWDETQSEWIRIDATPSGDPQLDEQEESGEAVPGDYGEQEAVGPSDEYLAELEEKLSELTEKLSYSDEERQLAEAAGVELSEARQIVKEIAEAEDTRLPNGQRVVDLLSQLFSLIVEARRTATPDYTGPLRKREGGEEIDDIVAHKIGIKAGEIDPRSRQKPFERQSVEQIFGGFDLYLIGDKSGSMSDTVDGEAKWQIQRRAEYLIFSALNRFDQNIQRANLRSDHALSVRSQGISFRNSDEIDEDHPLSNTFSAEDKVKLWRSLGNQGSGNGDVAALSHVLRQIETERKETEEQNKTDDRLRIVISCSDGYPDNPPAVKNLAGQLGQLNAVVVGLGLTETAAAVPAIFTTETSRGEVVKDINHLPAVVARNVILEATRLFPEKSKKSVDKIVASILDKFGLLN
jgi:hypothetical protein